MDIEAELVSVLLIGEPGLWIGQTSFPGKRLPAWDSLLFIETKR